MDEEKICDLEVTIILKEQYKNDLIKSFLTKLINKKQQDNSYNNLQLLADVSFYYQEITNTIDITNNILEINYWNNSDINNILNLIENEVIAKIINSEKNNNLANNDLTNNKYPKQQILI